MLSTEQLQALQLAKRYCQDISGKFVSPLTPASLPGLTPCLCPQQQQKQALQQVNQMQSLQEAANRQRALLLMSRIYIGSINFELGEEAVSRAAHKGLNHKFKGELVSLLTVWCVLGEGSFRAVWNDKSSEHVVGQCHHEA